jgi:4-diphosphocytidyl-2-C-methyl-D-erythritol kinase
VTVAGRAVHERAFAKVNLILHVGPRRADGLHPLCSLLASLDLADEVSVRPADGDGDTVVCPGVEGQNLVERALEALRDALPGGLPPLEVEIDKRIPVAAGLGGGSADAAAVLRAGNVLAGSPLDGEGLRRIGAAVGADVPAQVEPRNALVTGAGEEVHPLELSSMSLLLVPQAEGLGTPDVYAELDRRGLARDALDPGGLRAVAGASVEEIAAAVENDLEAAALSLRPELARTLDALRSAGALAAAVSGSGPTTFGIFPDWPEAERAATEVPGSLVAAVREAP